jgi:SAM-dependent methyltransferase
LNSDSNSEQKGFAEGFWSKDEIKDVFLDEQREYLLNEDCFGRILVPLLGLREDSVILDVGCGLGFLGAKLAESVPKGKAIGIELDPKLIEQAKIRMEQMRGGLVCGLSLLAYPFRWNKKRSKERKTVFTQRVLSILCCR